MKGGSRSNGARARTVLVFYLGVVAHTSMPGLILESPSARTPVFIFCTLHLTSGIQLWWSGCLLWYMWKYEKTRQELQTLGTTPSIVRVNEKLAWFDDTARQVLLLPVHVGVVYVLLRLLYSEALLMT
jgi:hypothetical protein